MRPGAVRTDDVAKCRKCRRAVLWVTTPAGKRMPLDLEPADPREADVAVWAPGRGLPKLAVIITAGGEDNLRQDLSRLLGLRTRHWKSSPTCAPDFVPRRQRADIDG